MPDIHGMSTIWNVCCWKVSLYIDLTVEAYEEYFKITSGEGFLLNPIMDIHCSTTERVADQNRMPADVKGGTAKVFYFVEVINE